MTTLAVLRPLVAADLRDAGMVTFTSAVIDELINAALAEIGRIIPGRFRMDITPVADQLDYRLRRFGSDIALTTPFGAAATDVLTSTAHGLTANTPIRFVSLIGGTGLTIGTTYYVIASGLTADAFKVSASLGGAAVDVTSNVTSGTFYAVTSDDPIPEIEVQRVEVWDTTTTPWSVVSKLASKYSEYVNYSGAGWEIWNGVLTLPNTVEAVLDPTKHLLRVWGYAPYAKLTTSPANTVTLSVEQEYALRDYVRVEAIKTLLASRELFTQWQTASRNTDTTFASLNSLFAQFSESWRRRARALQVLREAG